MFAKKKKKKKTITIITKYKFRFQQKPNSSTKTNLFQKHIFVNWAMCHTISHWLKNETKIVSFAFFFSTL